MPVRRQWTDLQPDLLAVVSGRLHDAAEYVRFHAVCKPWRESLTASTALRPVFFPWLVAPPSSRRPSDMKLRCVFSQTSYRAEAPASYNWVARADGTAVWFFSASHENKLVDPFTGDATALPPFVGGYGKTKQRMENSGGVLYGDGTVFLYNFLYKFVYGESVLKDEDGDILECMVKHVESSTSFRAAILRPGDTAWKFVDRLFRLQMYDAEDLRKHLFLAAYRVDDGKTLFRVHDYNDTCWNLLPPPVGDHDASQAKCEMTGKIPEGDVPADDWYLESSHVLESRGELLRVSLQIIRSSTRQLPAAHEVSVSVHALEEEVDAHGRHMVRWARREGLSFADRVMFLGLPTSFAVEASRFHGDVSGGWVYFLQRWSDAYEQSLTRPRVFRYNLIDEKAKFMEELVEHRGNEAFMWLMPKPAIAPIQVIRERMASPKTGDPNLKISIFRMEKPKHSNEPFISFNVWNLPPGVDSSRLHSFFNKHGKVSNAEVTSQGKGCVTMSMATLYKPYEVQDALDELVLDGNTLKVCEATMAMGELCVASSRGAVATP